MRTHWLSTALAAPATSWGGSGIQPNAATGQNRSTTVLGQMQLATKPLGAGGKEATLTFLQQSPTLTFGGQTKLIPTLTTSGKGNQETPAVRATDLGLSLRTSYTTVAIYRLVGVPEGGA